VTAIDAHGRYHITGLDTPEYTVCQDLHLARPVRVHWVADSSRQEFVRSRLATLQLVRSPYIALIYDLVERDGRLGIVEEGLDRDVVTSDANRLVRLYQFCAGLAALHENQLAHGALQGPCFRTAHGSAPRANTPRLCNLAFDADNLDDPTSDGISASDRLGSMGADQVKDDIFQTALAGLLFWTHGEAPLVSVLRDRLAAILLTNTHRALIHWRGTSVELGSQNRTARLKHPAEIGTVRVDYDGTRFYLGEVVGEVLVNNIPAVLGQNLPDSCVIALGDTTRPASGRYFVTFDQSHPEVMNATE